MTGRERFLTALNNEKPDHLPCQVHGWMGYYLEHFLDGVDQWEAYERLGMDPVIYAGAESVFDPADLADWQVKETDLGTDADGVRRSVRRIETPSGALTSRSSANAFTAWETEHLIKTHGDFEIWSKHVPVPRTLETSGWARARERLGDRGIVRGCVFGFGQGSPWQDLCILMGTQPAILACLDEPDWVHAALADINAKRIGLWERTGELRCDVVETGGGAGSGTVIGPKVHEEFCLPYDRAQHEALKACCGVRIVYHLCGGVMPQLELVARNLADGLETMTPPSMGGDCDLAEATRRVGEKLFFIGGFDQNAGFEKGTPENVRRQVHALHAACPDGGYICCPSDHFFFGDPENVRTFADCCRECTY